MYCFAYAVLFALSLISLAGKAFVIVILSARLARSAFGSHQRSAVAAKQFACLLKWTTFFQVRNFCLKVYNRYELRVRRFYLPEWRR